jgi:hypothetical protein
MNIPGKIASSTLILIGLAWLTTVFLNPRTWTTRSANQLNSAGQNGATTQNFTTPKGNVPLAGGTQVTIDQNTLSTESTQPAQERVRQANQTLNSPDQSAQAPAVVTPAATPAATPTPTVVATPAPAPSPKVIAEPVQAGW